MRDFFIHSVYFGVVLSLAGYFLGMFLRKKVKSDLCNPLLIAVLFVIGFLLLTGISYEDYNAGAQYLSYLLTPATVCLAVPLYQQLSLLRKHWKAVLLGIVSGVLASVGSVLLFAFLFGLSHEHYVTLLPKSVTTAIGIGITEELGGIPAIASAVIILTGILGNVTAKGFCRLLRIRDPIAVGLAIGTASHALGTAKALELGEIEGAMSSLSVAISGLLTVIFASVFSNFL